jgi:curved DNA-binding protein CbpA
MTDPYKVLGVSPTADDSEIKSAYKKLVKKYHPDKYQDDAMAELANEKMTEINAAYDQIMDERKNGGSQNSYGGYGSNSYGYGQSGTGTGGYSTSGSGVNYQRIRMMIHAGNLTGADNFLRSVPVESRTAEWYFLWGTVCYQRGWLNEAYNNILKASQMDPTNSEYASALRQMNMQRSGYMTGGSRYNTGNTANDTCNCLSDLCIADCCCEAMGGDLIPCC